jgi:hypothetical protein
MSKAVAMCEFWIFAAPGELAETWAAHRDGALADWIAESPGRRPQQWWEFDAPEPRQRLGGIGTTQREAGLAIGLSYSLGIPRGWISTADVARWGRGVAIDPDDPPTFESEASYLQRHCLLFPGEKRRLKPADFEPEQVQ